MAVSLKCRGRIVDDQTPKGRARADTSVAPFGLSGSTASIIFDGFGWRRFVNFKGEIELRPKKAFQSKGRNSRYENKWHR